MYNLLSARDNNLEFAPAHETDDASFVAVFGPPGVGKSTIGWQVYRRMAADRWACAYVDIDQLGICYPELRSDPGRYRLKERNLSAVAANFADDGARGVVVSGVGEPRRWHGSR